MTAVESLSPPQAEARATFPRLLYLGCVPVERSFHGSLLLYRLLEGWPADRLKVVEGVVGRSAPQRRLEGVDYRALAPAQLRLLTTRFHGLASAALTLGAPLLARAAEHLLAGWRPDAVLTVAHGYAWLAAAALAQRLGLRLHLVVHDDWPRLAPTGPLPRDAVERRFAAVYRRAASRLCVSPGMAEEYAGRYGPTGDVLYPLRGRGAVPPSRAERSPGAPLTVAFAGTISTPGSAAALRRVAASLARRGGRLLIYGPLSREATAALGLAGDTVALGGLVDPQELPKRLAAEADILFLPMSFAPSDRENMRLGFPSKLTDYTLVGRPILLYGPADCSAAQWADKNPGAIEAVLSEDEGLLDQALARLADDAALRARLSERAAAAGERDFGHAAAFRSFCGAVLSPRSELDI